MVAKSSGGERFLSTVSDCVNAIHSSVGERVKLVNASDGPSLPEMLQMYTVEQGEPVIVDRVRLSRLVPPVLIFQFSGRRKE